MIRVPLSHFFEIYLGALLIAVWIIWIGANWRRRRQEIRAQRRIVECNICHHTFLHSNPSRHSLPRCPNCGRLNERQPFSSL